MTTTEIPLFQLPPDRSKHAHVTSKDWTRANLCTCGRYRCTVLMAIDGEAR